jgi:hypothetical protein
MNQIIRLWVKFLANMCEIREECINFADEEPPVWSGFAEYSGRPEQ